MGGRWNKLLQSPDFSCGSYSLYKDYIPLVSRWNLYLLVGLRFRHADFKDCVIDPSCKLRTHCSSGRVFIIVGARFVLLGLATHYRKAIPNEYLTLCCAGKIILNLGR